MGGVARGDPASQLSGRWYDCWWGPRAPPATAGTLLAYDSHTDRFVFFGEWNGTTLDHTWEFDPVNRTWTQIANGTVQRLNDAGKFSLGANQWAKLTTSRSPSLRSDAATAFDPMMDEEFLFGGFTGSLYRGDSG